MAIAVPWVLSGSETDPCCCPPSGCCLYPWPDPDGEFSGPLFPSSDLPGTLLYTNDGDVIDALELVGDYRYEGELFIISAYRPTGWEGEWTGWRRSSLGDDSSLLGVFGCLVTSDDVEGIIVAIEDEFPDTLQYSIDTIDPSPLTGEILRENLCDWGEGGDEVQIRYGGDPSEPYKWATVNVLGFSGYFIKDGPQDSPVGVYRQGADTVTITE